MPNQKTRGFTLIEVLVALVILAIALFAVLKALNASIQNVSHIRTKVAAHWVALNLLAQMQSSYLEAPSPIAENEGNETMLKQTWQWRAKVTQQGSPYYERIQIQVSTKGELLETLSGFLWLGEKGGTRE